MNLQNHTRATLTIGCNQGQQGDNPGAPIRSETVKATILQQLRLFQFPGATIRLALGVWEGATEHSFEVTILDDRVLGVAEDWPSEAFQARILDLSRSLRELLAQDAILVTIDIARVAFIEA
jgi:hypothetical protein